MIHPQTEVRFIDAEVGYGVFAKAAIPCGTLTWVRDRLDREFTAAELEAFDLAHREILDHYSYRNAQGNYVFCWDHARFMNHSARPNCLLTPYGVEVAVRDIAAGEELTNDYGLFNIIEPFVPREEEHGRERVCNDDLTRHSARWDEEIASAIVYLLEVEQPLRSMLDPAVFEQLCEVAAHRQALRSTAELFFGGA